jgi:hypothetical protein
MNTWKGPERRKSPRISKELVVHLRKATAIEARKQYTRNISGGGAFIEDPRDLQPGDLVDLRLTVPEGNLDIVGVVRWRRDEEPRGVGVDFLRAASDDRESLNNFIKKQMEMGLDERQGGKRHD